MSSQHILLLPTLPGLRASLPPCSTTITALALSCSLSVLQTAHSKRPSLALNFKSRSLLPPHLPQGILDFPGIERSELNSCGSQGDLDRQRGMIMCL